MYEEAYYFALRSRKSGFLHSRCMLCKMKEAYKGRYVKLANGLDMRVSR